MNTSAPTTARVTGPRAAEPAGRLSRRGDPAWEVALLFPLQGNWTEAEYLALDTNRLVELVDGCVEVLPMPTYLHQLIARYLHRLLDDFVAAAKLPGTVLFAPMPVRLWEGQFREPDIVYVRPEHVPNRRGQPEGAALVVEIVSPGPENRERDLEIKRREYAQAHIPEYWIVDPEERKIVVLTLEGSAYRVHGDFAAGATATSVLLPGFSVSADDLFKAAEED